MTETGSGRPDRNGSGSGESDAWGLVGVLIVAAFVRVVAWSRTAALFNDGPVFLGMAEAIAEGRWEEVLAHPFHPLYPALIATVAVLPIGLESAAVAVSVFGGLLSVGAIFCFTRRAFDREIAWLSAWTVALHPWAVDFSSDVMSDGLYAGLYLVGFAAMASLVTRPRPALAVACGVAAGLAYLTRPEGVGLVVSCELLLALTLVRGEGETRRRVLAGLIVPIAAALVMAPLLLGIASQTGELGLTRKKSLSGLILGPSAAADGAGGALSQPPAGGGRIPLPRSSVRADERGDTRPSRDLAGFLEAASRAGRTSLAALRYEIAAFALLGLVSMGSRRRPLREATVAVPALLHTGVLVLLVWSAGYVARRHALAALLPLCGYAALGWRAIWIAGVERLRFREPLRAARWRSSFALSLALVLVLSLVWGARDLRERRAERESLREAAEWLEAQTPPPRRVAAQKLRVAYYAGAEYVPLPSGLDAPIVARLRAEGVGWVVIDERGLGDHLGLEAGLGDWLRRVHLVERRGVRAWVLEVEP